MTLNIIFSVVRLYALWVQYNLTRIQVLRNPIVCLDLDEYPYISNNHNYTYFIILFGTKFLCWNQYALIPLGVCRLKG